MFCSASSVVCSRVVLNCYDTTQSGLQRALGLSMSCESAWAVWDESLPRKLFVRRRHVGFLRLSERPCDI